MQSDPEPNETFEVGGIENGEAKEDAGGAGAISDLSAKVEVLERKLRDERFLFICVGTVLFDALAFHSMPSWGGPVSILVLQIVALLVLARMFGVSELVQLTNELIATFKRPG